MADLVAALRRHERIGIDTPIFVYHFEGTTHLTDLQVWMLADFV